MSRAISTEVPVIDGPGFLVVDTETTGFGASDRVIEIALVHLDCDGVIQSTFSTLLRGDGYAGHPVAQSVHGIHSAHLRCAPEFETIVDDIHRAFAGDRILVAHNEAFDRRMLNQEFARAARPVMRRQLLCTMALASDLGYGRMSLAKATSTFALRSKPTHAACEDAIATAELLVALRRRHPREFSTHVARLGYRL